MITQLSQSQLIDDDGSHSGPHRRSLSRSTSLLALNAHETLSDSGEYTVAAVSTASDTGKFSFRIGNLMVAKTNHIHFIILKKNNE